jgi:short-subunit dehydrogenase
MVAVNAVHPAYLAKVMIDKLLARKEKSAMIVTASVAGLRSMAGNTIYGCTKTFATFLGEGLSFEYKGKIDFLAWQPGYVHTKMVGFK